MSILRVVAGDGLQHYCSVGDGSRDWADMIERERKRDHPAHADPSVGWFQANDPTLRRGFPDGAGRVRTNGCNAETGGYRGGRPARRSAGNAGNIPWIVDRAVVTDDRTAAIGAFVEI